MPSRRPVTPSSGRGFPLLVISAVLWGTVPVATSGIYRIAETNPLSIGFLRLALSLFILIPAAIWITERSAWRLPRRDAAIVLVFGGAIALYQVCFFAAIPRLGVTVASLLTICTAPVLVVLLAVPLLGEKLTGRVALALVAAVGGTALLVSVRPPSIARPDAFAAGVFLALGAALGYAVVTLCARSLTGRYHLLQMNAVGMTVGALLLLPFALYGGLVVHYPPAAWALLLHLGLAPTALAYLLFFYALQFTPATVAAIVTLLEPLTSTILARILFDERLGPLGLLGAALLLGAMVLLYWRPRGP